MMSEKITYKSFFKKIFAIERIINSCSRLFKSKFEFVVMFNLYDNKNKIKHSLIKSNLSDYVDNSHLLINHINQEIRRKLEKKRFWNLVNLPEFNVICVEDKVGHEVLQKYENEGYQWLTKGEQYTVIGSKESFEGYAFKIRKKDGTVMGCPEPLDGFSSLRFVPIDYAYFN